MPMRFIIAAAGGLVALLGVAFTAIDSNWFATVVLLVGLVMTVGGLWKETRPVAVKVGMALVAFMRRVFASVANGIASWRTARAAARAASTWPARGRYAVAVVGESMYQDALAAAAGGQSGGPLGIPRPAQLVPEPRNPADPNAVSVRINRRTVGYLSRPDAIAFHERLAATGTAGRTTSCGAIIRGGGVRSDGEEMFYGVWLDLDPL